MIKYNEFKELKELQESKTLTEDMEDKISILLYLTEAQEVLILEDVHSWLDKVGLKIHKGTGLLDYMKAFAVGAGKIFIAAIKKDEEEVKKIAATLQKAHVIDFLLKLDMATMHIVTGPIHFVDAVTGWDLMANIKKASAGAKSRLKAFYAALKSVKDSVVAVLDGAKQKKMLSKVDAIDSSMPNL